MPEGDREPDGGLPEDFGNCMKISMFYHFQCICSYCFLFRRFMMVKDLLDPCLPILDLIHRIDVLQLNLCFWPRKYVGSHGNVLEILGYVFTGLWGVSGL